MRNQLIQEIKELQKLIEQEKGALRAHKDTVDALKWRDRARIDQGISHIII